jgi:hypothetical protein
MHPRFLSQLHQVCLKLSDLVKSLFFIQKPTIQTIWGFLKMGILKLGDPHVTMDFNTKMVSHH